MSGSLILQELGIVVAMQQPNPSLVTVEFLKLSGVIPTEWQLARQPVNNEEISQLLFTNGVSIVVEPNRIMFGESIGEKEINTLTVAQIAITYLNIFKVAGYQAIGINIRSYSAQPSQLAATQYINHQLLADGSWQNYGIAPIQTALNVIYTLEGRQLTLSVNAAGIQFAEQEVTPVILFSGNFSYQLATPTAMGDLAAASQILTNWREDLTAYSELINERFLKSQPPTFDIPTATQIGQDDLAGLDIVYAPDIFPKIVMA